MEMKFSNFYWHFFENTWKRHSIWKPLATPLPGMKIIYLLHQLLVLCRAGVFRPSNCIVFFGYFRLLQKEGWGGDTTSVFVVFISLTVIIFKLFLVEYLIEIHAWSFAKLHSWFSDVIVRISSFRLGSIDDSRSFVRPSVYPLHMATTPRKEHHDFYQFFLLRSFLRQIKNVCCCYLVKLLLNNCCLWRG